MSDHHAIGIMLINNPAMIPLQFPDEATRLRFIDAVDYEDSPVVRTKLVNEDGITMCAKFRKDNIVAIFYDEV